MSSPFNGLSTVERREKENQEQRSLISIELFNYLQDRTTYFVIGLFFAPVLDTLLPVLSAGSHFFNYRGLPGASHALLGSPQNYW